MGLCEPRSTSTQDKWVPGSAPWERKAFDPSKGGLVLGLFRGCPSPNGDDVGSQPQAPGRDLAGQLGQPLSVPLSFSKVELLGP